MAGLESGALQTTNATATNGTFRGRPGQQQSCSCACPNTCVGQQRKVSQAEMALGPAPSRNTTSGSLQLQASSVEGIPPPLDVQQAASQPTDSFLQTDGGNTPAAPALTAQTGQQDSMPAGSTSSAEIVRTQEGAPTLGGYPAGR